MTRSQVGSRPFTQGKVGLKWDIFPTIESVNVASKGQFAFDVAPVPKGPRGRVNRNVIGAYGLLAGAKNKALGWDWMKFLSTKEAHLYMANGGAVFPALKEAARSPEFLNPPPPTPQVNRKVFLDALEQDTLVQDPYTPAFGQIQTLVTGSCSRSGRGRRTPAPCCRPSPARSTPSWPAHERDRRTAQARDPHREPPGPSDGHAAAAGAPALRRPAPPSCSSPAGTSTTSATWPSPPASCAWCGATSRRRG